jgi:hypothetical protein
MAYSAQRACSCFGKMGEKSAIRYSRIQNAEKQDKKVGKEIGRAKPKYILRSMMTRRDNERRTDTRRHRYTMPEGSMDVKRQ